MKKVLLGTTAIIAASLISSGAYAQSTVMPATTNGGPVHLNFSGYFFGGYGYLAKDSNNGVPGGAANQAGYKHNSDAVQEDVLVNFSGDTKWDNGLGAGVFIQIRGENQAGKANVAASQYTPDTFKQTWLKVTGESFGEFRIGDYTDARRAKAYVAPQACGCGTEGFFGTNSPNLAFNNSPVGTNTTQAVLDNRFTKLAYFTPTIQGFQFVATYAPEGSKGVVKGGDALASGFNGGGATGLVTNGPTKFRDLYSGALSWDATINDVKIGLSTGFTGASRDQVLVAGSNADPFDWEFGGQVGYGPWKFGGAYEEQHHFNSNGSNVFISTNLNQVTQKTSDIGVAYTVGPFGVALDWSEGRYEGIFAQSVKKAATNDIAQLDGTYNIGPGVQLLAGVQLANWDPNGAKAAVAGGNAVAVQDYTSVALLFGTAVHF